MPDINMFIINDYTNASVSLYSQLAEVVSFPVYQDTTVLNLWSDVYGGDKDDFFIFDRCGKMTYHIRFPDSYLGYAHTQRALWTTYRENQCHCHLNPSQQRGHRSRNRNRNRAGRNRGQRRRGHHQGNHGHNHRQEDPHDRMQGDAPVAVHRNQRTMSHRCHGDIMCRMLRRLSRSRQANSYRQRHRQY